MLTRIWGDAASGGVELDEFADEIATDSESLGEGAVTAFLVGVRVNDFLAEIVGVRGGHTQV